MKKTVSLLLALLLAIGCLAGSLAEDASENVKFDLSVIKANEDAALSEDPDDPASAYVMLADGKLSMDTYAIAHGHESQKRYSLAEFDFLIRDYNTEDPFPVWRLWFTVFTEGQFYNFESVTLTLGGKDYTFTDVANENWYYDLGDGDYAQQLLVVFGANEMEFLIALEDFLEPMTSGTEVLDAKVPIVLHGTEDISGEISGGFLLQYMLFRSMYIDSKGLQLIDKVGYSTPMTVK